MRTTLSNLPRWAHGHHDIPTQWDRKLILKQLDEFLSWPEEVFSHAAMLIRIDRPDLTNLLAAQLGVTAEEIYLWSEFKQLPNHARRADVMERLMRPH
ncbi:MAG: hypothetical protein HQ488_03655 [Parcubacteria group bacterium]|nr:hypothetical protein [Parcubacteria group bacterium]